MSTKKKIITAIIGVEAVIIAAVIVFLFYINSDTVKVNRQLELAQKYLLEKDYEQAIAVFEGIIEIDPKNEEAYLGMAEAYAAVDDLENAVKILEKASKRVDSEEVLVMLETHTAEIEQRQQAAQRAAAQAASDAAASSEQTAAEASPQDTNAIETQTPETEMVLTGFIVQDGELYYYDETGNYVTGWFDKNDNRYCARDDGRLYKDGEHEIDSTKYLFDQGGVCLGEVEEKKEQLPFDTSMYFCFSSGAGGWGTEIDLNPDGSFSGHYHDSNMGETGEGYPGGTVYFCSFSGKFDNITQVNAYTYSLNLKNITIDNPVGEETIEDDILWIASEPYGLEDGKEFLLYTPETPLSELSEEFLSWWPGRYDSDHASKKTLSYYGLYNVKMEYGFFD